MQPHLCTFYRSVTILGTDRFGGHRILFYVARSVRVEHYPGVHRSMLKRSTAVAAGVLDICVKSSGERVTSFKLKSNHGMRPAGLEAAFDPNSG